LGIIKKQSLQSSIINFIGIGIGSITRLLMPFVLTTTQIGLLGLLDSISGSFISFFNMGFNLILKNLFPKFRNNQEGHAGFFSFGIMLSLIGIVTAICSFYLFENAILSNQANDIPIIQEYAFLIPILIFFRIMYMNLDGYVRILYKTVIGTFLDGFLAKIMLLIILILFTQSILTFNSFIYLYALTLSMPGLIIIGVAVKNTEKITLPKKALIQKENKIPSLVLFGILSGSAGSLISFVDTFMIYKMYPENPEDYVGVYSIMLLATVLITIPAKSLNKISSVILADSWIKRDIRNIENIYKKSCNNLLIVGGFLFIVGWACIDEVLYYLPDYQKGKYIFFFLGLARIVDLATGVNADIIETSKKYKYNTYFNIALGILVVSLNYILISSHGIVGAALATLIGVASINIARSLFLISKYKLNPYNRQFWKSAAHFIILTICVSVFDYEVNPLLKIAINVIVITAVFWFTIYKFNLSADITESIDRIWKKIKR
jgi:O-antigen/teichoic acid export membrane protein